MSPLEQDCKPFEQQQVTDDSKCGGALHGALSLQKTTPESDHADHHHDQVDHDQADATLATCPITLTDTTRQRIVDLIQVEGSR